MNVQGTARDGEGRLTIVPKSGKLVMSSFDSIIEVKSTYTTQPSMYVVWLGVIITGGSRVTRLSSTRMRQTPSPQSMSRVRMRAITKWPRTMAFGGSSVGAGRGSSATAVR